MSSGMLSARVFTSMANIPVPNAGVGITKIIDGKDALMGYDITDENGKTVPVILEAPPIGADETPDKPLSCAVYTMKAVHPGYKPVVIEGVRVFENTKTIQNFLLIPIKENPVLAFEAQKLVFE